MSVLLLSAFLLVASSAAAEIRVVDLSEPGDGLVTRDTESELDWLDVTEPMGWTYAEIQSGAGGWSAEGWRHATAAEICEFFARLGGVTTPCPGHGYLPDPNSGRTHIDMLGTTHVRQQPYGGGTLTLEEIWALYNDGGTDPSPGVLEFSFDTHSDGWTNTYMGMYENGSYSYDSNLLVRPMPEPGRDVLLLAGIASLSAIAACGRGGSDLRDPGAIRTRDPQLRRLVLYPG